MLRTRRGRVILSLIDAAIVASGEASETFRVNRSTALRGSRHPGHRGRVRHRSRAGQGGRHHSCRRSPPGSRALVCSSTSSTDEFSWGETAWSPLRRYPKPANRQLCACIAGSPSKRAWPKASNVALVTQFSSCRPAHTRSKKLPFGVLAQRPRRNSARDVGAAPFLRRPSRNAAPNSSFTSPRLRHMEQAPRRVRFRNARLRSRACVNHRAPELVTSLSPSSQHAFERGVAVAQPTRNAPDRLVSARTLTGASFGSVAVGET